MTDRPRPESPFDRSVADLEQLARRAASRCRALAGLAADRDPMNPRARSLRSVLASLEEAVSGLGVQVGRPLTLELDAGGDSRRQRMVARCARGVLDSLDAPEGAADLGAGADRESSEPSLTGRSAVLPVSQLLDLFGSLGMTGRLEVSTVAETFVLALSDGDLIQAVSDSSPAGYRLGEILVEQGALQPDELVRLTTEVRRSGTLLGTFVRNAEMVSEEQLCRAIEFQTQALFDRMLDVRDARFAFFVGATEVAAVTNRTSLRRLLLEAALRGGKAA